MKENSRVTLFVCGYLRDRRTPQAVRSSTKRGVHIELRDLVQRHPPHLIDVVAGYGGRSGSVAGVAT